MWSIGFAGSSGAGPSTSARPRYSFSRISRNFSTPQSASRNLRRARVRSRRWPESRKIPTTPSQTSGISSSGTQTPSRSASRGLVESPPPTQRSNPGPCTGCSTPRNEMSFTWYGVSTSQETDDLNLRGRFEYRGSPMYRSMISSIAGVASMTSSTAMPATGLPSTTRGQSPQASVVCRPTASSRRQISGPSSIRLQYGRAAAVDARLALRVQAPPAEPSPQVLRVDRGEAAARVDVLDPGPYVERVVVLLDPLVRIQRLPVSERPLALAAGLAGPGGLPR